VRGLERYFSYNVSMRGPAHYEIRRIREHGKAARRTRTKVDILKQLPNECTNQFCNNFFRTHSRHKPCSRSRMRVSEKCTYLEVIVLGATYAQTRADAIELLFPEDAVLQATGEPLSTRRFVGEIS
jgi:hypothetical protein